MGMLWRSKASAAKADVNEAAATQGEKEVMIKLTLNASLNASDNSIWISKRHIVAAIPNSDDFGCRVLTSCGVLYEVKQSAGAVADMIEKETT